MKIQILGTGCTKCKMLAEKTEEALKELGLACEIEKVTEMRDIAGFGVLATPALVVDGEVKVYGRVPPKSELKALLSKQG